MPRILKETRWLTNTFIGAYPATAHHNVERGLPFSQVFSPRFAERFQNLKVSLRAARSPGDSPVGGHDEDRSHVALERAVQVRETLDVQHVHLIDEQNLYNGT